MPPALEPRHQGASPPNHSSAPHSSANIRTRGSRCRPPSNPDTKAHPHRTIPPPLIPLPISEPAAHDAARPPTPTPRRIPTEPFLRPSFLCQYPNPRLTRPPALQLRHQGASPPNHSSAPHSSANIRTRGSRGRPPSNPGTKALPRRTIPLPLIPLPISEPTARGAARPPRTERAARGTARRRSPRTGIASAGPVRWRRLRTERPLGHTRRRAPRRLRGRRRTMCHRQRTSRWSRPPRRT